MSDAKHSTHPPATDFEEQMYCPECGYDLRGLQRPRCPECGYDLTREPDAVSPIPWEIRDGIGRVRAFYATAFKVSLRHKQFCDAVARPVNYDDSQRFRWLTIAHAFVAIALFTGTILYVVQFRAPAGEAPRDPVTFWGSIVAGHFLLFLYLAAATGLPSYFFHPRAISIEMQNRAIAMSYYSCGAIIWLIVPTVLMSVGLLLKGQWEDVGTVLLVIGICMLPAPVLFWWFDLLHVALRVMPQLRRRMYTIAVAVPALWCLSGVVIFGCTGAAIVYAYFAFTSEM